MSARRAVLACAAICAASMIGPRAAECQVLDRRHRPVAPPARAFVFPKVTEHVLANGLRIQVVENHELPIVAVRMAMSADSTEDPAGKEGLASVTLAMLREGTARASADQLAREMAAIGTPVAPAGFTTTTSHVDRALDLLADMWLHPAFADSALKRVEALRAAALRQQQAVPSYVARAIFYRLLYGSEHPFFRAPTDTSIATISRDDVVRFHDQYVRPQNTTIIVVGDVRPASVLAKLTRVFGAWPRGGVTAAPHTEPVAPRQATTIFLHDAPGASQATVFVGEMGPPRTAPDFFALETANTLFGAIPGSRLWQALRERHGFTYGVLSTSLWRRSPEPSTIRGSTNVNSPKTDSAVVVWLDELKAMRGERAPTDEELERARMAQVGSLPIQLETVDQIATALVRLSLAGEAPDFYSRLAARVPALTTSDITAAARKYFDPDHLVIVIVGDRKTIEPALRAANVAPVVIVDASGRPIS
ncbi:MAG TPA: pitrilysin family protein [Gemmatimonadaceae bacterium]